MTWFKLDDGFHSHPKVIAAGNEAVGLYVRCGTYAAQHLTEGFVPEHVALLYGSAELADTLVRTKLWRRARGGWRMPDYLDYNPSREAVDNDRKMKAERQARWRSRHGRDHSETRETVDAKTGPTPVDNPVGELNSRSTTHGRRVTNPSRNASGDGAPTRPAPKEAGRARPSPGANGRASPPGSPAAPKPSWCGQCEEATRQTGDPPHRCLTCHPLTAKEPA